MIMLTLMLATKGIAAVPGGVFIVVAGTAASLGLPIEGGALLAIYKAIAIEYQLCYFACNL